MDLSDNHVFHLFVIRTNNRQELQDYLLKNELHAMQFIIRHTNKKKHYRVLLMSYLFLAIRENDRWF
jgi:hypothetical protein